MSVKDLSDRDARTHAIKKLHFALVNPDGVPVSLHTDFDGALGQYTKSRQGIILNEEYRRLYFASMLAKKWSIRKCYAWVRVEKIGIIKLPKAKS